MPLTSIRIRKYKFTFPDRFAAGHELTASEAQALNALRAENIRNNVDSAVVGCIRDGELAPEDHAELAAMITKYAESYEFQPRARPSDKPSAIEIAAREIAEERAMEDGNERGSPQWDYAVAEWETQAEIQLLARQRAKLAQETTMEALGLGELGGI